MTKKRITKILCLLVAMTLSLLCACGDGSDISSPESSYEIGSSDTGESSHDTSDPDSSSVPEESSQAPDLRPWDEITELLLRDNEIARLIAGCEIIGSEPTMEFSSYELPPDNPYYEFQALRSLLDSVYTKESGITERYFSFPTSSGATVFPVLGYTNVNTAYIMSDIPSPDLSTLDIVMTSADTLTATLLGSDGKSYTIGAVKSEGKWKLENSMLFICVDAPFEIPWLESGLEHDQNEGSAKRLSGNCLVVNIFIDDAVSKWNDTAVQGVLGQLDTAVKFLEGEAERYGTELNLSYTDAVDSIYIKTSRTASTDMYDRFWIDLLFAETTYRTLEGCVREYVNLNAYDNWCVMLHMNKQGRSYATPCNSDHYDYEMNYAEKAVMFYSTDTAYTYFTVPGTYAHELLHLFGADDLYGEYVPPETDDLLSWFAPNAIMRVIPYDLGYAAVCPYTAYRVGWVDGLRPPFDKVISFT